MQGHKPPTFDRFAEDYLACFVAAMRLDALRQDEAGERRAAHALHVAADWIAQEHHLEESVEQLLRGSED